MDQRHSSALLDSSCCLGLTLDWAAPSIMDLSEIQVELSWAQLERSLGQANYASAHK